MKVIFSKTLIGILIFAGSILQVNAQIQSGKIIYERRTNIYKRFGTESIKDWVKEKDKIKTETFTLSFNDSLSFFEYQESDLKDPLSWTTTKSSVYSNSNSGIQLKIKSVYGEKLFLQDTLKPLSWKITDSKRNIAGYSCRKALCEPDDSTTIYAWYCTEVTPSIGPEGFGGLPGAILGLATEDGGVVYFAKSVDRINIPINQLTAKESKGKIYQREELRAKLEKQFGDYEWGKNMIKNIFAYL